MCEKIFPIIDLIIKPRIPWKYVLRRFKFYNLFSETFYKKMENSQQWGNYDYPNYVTEVILGSFNRDKSNAIDMIKFILCNYSYLEEDEINEILILDDTVDILIKKQYNDLDDFDDLIFDINKSIINEKHVLTLDRLHTLMLKWVKHLIRKLKKYLPIMILNPTKEIIRKYTKKLINSCTQSPNKDIKNPTTARNKKKQRKFNINYKPT